MNIFCNAKGNVFYASAEKIYQGSIGVNEICFIGEFPSSAQVLMAYRLPNGDYRPPIMLTRETTLDEVQAPNGGLWSVWKGRIGATPKTENGEVVKDENGNVLYDLDPTITENYGTASVRFFVYGVNGKLATEEVNFTIEKGLPVYLDATELQTTSAELLLEQILSVLADTENSYRTISQAVDVTFEKVNDIEKDVESLRKEIAEGVGGAGKYLPLTGGTLGGKLAVQEEVAVYSQSYLVTKYGIGVITTPFGDKVNLPKKAGTIAVEEDVSPIINKVDLLTQVVSQTGLVYTADETETWNERITADGENILNGSTAILKKVVGDTVACKQLFIPENIINFGNTGSGTIFDETENAYLIPSVGSYYYSRNKYLYEFQGKESTQYTFTAEIKQGTAVNIGFVFHYADDTTSNVSNRMQPNEYTLYTATSEAGKTIIGISLNYQTNGSMYFKNARLNEGTADLGYQPYFTGLKSAYFGGIESTNANGTEINTLSFPNTPTPLGTTIDYETQKITNYGVDLVLKGTESITYANSLKNGSVILNNLLGANEKAIGVCTDATIVQKLPSANGEMQLGDGRNTANPIFWYGILAQLGFWESTDDNSTAIEKFKAYLAQRYADGNPVTIRYVSSTLQSETTLKTDNEYTVYKGGVEKVLGNNNAEYGAKNTLTVNYVYVEGVK